MTSEAEYVLFVQAVNTYTRKMQQAGQDGNLAAIDDAAEMVFRLVTLWFSDRPAFRSVVRAKRPELTLV